jgi:hypothetical protein
MTSADYLDRLKEGIFSWLSRKTPEAGSQSIRELSAAIGTDLG